LPNTLAHIGVHLPLTRKLWRRSDALWIYLGCLLPDLPWILLRVLLTITPIDEPSLRLHAIGQASLFGSLLLAGSAAALARRPGRTFALLGFGTLVHLLLDACQYKWANGVSFFAPVDWRLVRFDLFWPEDLPTIALTALGAIVFLIESRRRRRQPTTTSCERWPSPPAGPGSRSSWTACGTCPTPVPITSSRRSTRLWHWTGHSWNTARASRSRGASSRLTRSPSWLSTTIPAGGCRSRSGTSTPTPGCCWSPSPGSAR